MCYDKTNRSKNIFIFYQEATVKEMKFKYIQHRNVLDYALNKINNSPIKGYINGLYLYGSCARQEENPHSDVDLFMELSEDIVKLNNYKQEIILLRGMIMTDDVMDPEVDLKIVIGDEWKNNRMLYYQNVQREGISIWH